VAGLFTNQIKMSKNCEYCFELKKNCVCEWYTCSGCGTKLSSWGTTYEYRGAYSCENCFEKVQENRDFERQQIIEEERHKTDRFNLDMSDSVIGKANRDILKRDIEIAKKESKRLKDYEGR
jgi:neutral trehalase